MNTAAESGNPALIAEEERDRPAVVRLAEYVSLAARIEPELLRAMRLAMLPQTDAGIEADLWFSSLAESQNSRYMLLRAEVSSGLRTRLARDSSRLDLAWTILKEVHRNAPPAIQIEEEITYLTLSGKPGTQDEVEKRFQSVLAAMRMPARRGLARWAARALPRLPEQARTTSAWVVALNATAQLGGAQVLNGEPPPDALNQVLQGSLLPAGLPMVDVGVHLFSDAIQLSQPPLEHSRTLAVPKTNPLVIGVEWFHDGKPQQDMVSLNIGETKKVDLDISSIRLFTAYGDSYSIEADFKQRAPLPVSSHSDLVVRGYPADNCVLLAFDLDKRFSRDLAGFAIECTPPDGTPYELKNRLTLGAAGPEGMPSSQAPFQRFRWIHSPDQIQEGLYSYHVSAMYFAKSGSLRKGPSFTLALPLRTPPLKGTTIAFTRGPAGADAATRIFRKSEGNESERLQSSGNEAIREWVGAGAHTLIMNFLDECLREPDLSLDACAYDLDHPEIIQVFQRLGPRLRLIIDDSPGHSRQKIDLTAQLKKAGCMVYPCHFKRFAHSRVMILKRKSTPVKVITGTVNFSLNGLYAQLNCAILIEDPAIASLYAEAFDLAAAKSREFAHSRLASQWFEFADRGISVSFAPHKHASISLDRVERAIRNAQSSLIFSLLPAARSPVVEALEYSMKRPDIFACGLYKKSIGTTEILRQHNSSVLRQQIARPRSEFDQGMGGLRCIIADFNDAGAVVFTGSSNFSNGGEISNGDNMIALYDPALASMFAVQMIRLMDYYRFRFAAASSRAAVSTRLDPSDSWTQRFYNPATPEYKERRLFAGTPIQP